MKVLIVDDEANIHKTTSMALKALGHIPFSAYSGSQAVKKLDEERMDAVFLDLNLGSENGIEIFDRIQAEGHDVPVIIFTAYSSIESAIEATKKGVFDYVLKPFVPEQIRQALARVQKNSELENRVTALESEVSSGTPPQLFESQVEGMQAIYRLADRAAPSDATVLLLGSSGTGKTVLAKRIHNKSKRADMPFVVVHCPSLSKELLESELFGHVKGAFTGAIKDTWGKIEAAEGGTLFLDEIGDLPFEIQAKLLRFLQERQYERVGETKTRSGNVRIIAATNKNLQEESREGNFREDLFYRLNVISIEMLPLTQRRGDIAALANSFLEHLARQQGSSCKGFSDAALKAMVSYSWPGNLRELHNAIERCLILASGDLIELHELPSDIWAKNSSNGSSANRLSIGGFHSLQEIEEAHISGVLANADNYQQAAEILGINKTTLYRKRKRSPELEGLVPEVTETV